MHTPEKIWKLLFVALILNIKPWLLLYLKITKKLFRHKARFLIFLKTRLLSLDSRSLHMVLTHLSMEWTFNKPLVVLLQLLKLIQNLRKKIKLATLILQKPQRGKKILTHPLFLTSTVIPPNLKPSSKVDLNGDDSLVSQLSTETFQNKPQLTSLYMVSTPHKFQINPNRFNDHYIMYSSKQIAPYEYWMANNQQISTVQNIF